MGTCGIIQCDPINVKHLKKTTIIFKTFNEIKILGTIEKVDFDYIIIILDKSTCFANCSQVLSFAVTKKTLAAATLKMELFKYENTDRFTIVLRVRA